MATKSFDKIDVFLSVIFLTFSLSSVGLATVDLFGTKLSEGIYTVGGTTLTINFVGSLLVLAFVYVTNNGRIDIRDYADEYMYTVVGAVVLVVGIQFVPVIRDAATSSDLAGIT